MKPRGPPILPMYKVTSNNKKKGGGILSVLMAILLPLFAICLLFFFFLSIYIGSYYLQEHLQDESPSGLLNSIGLPNTRNVIQKWSLENLHGIDLTKLGPPPKVVPQGMGGVGRSHTGNWSSYSNLHLPSSVANLGDRLGNGVQQLYHNTNATYLRGWLGPVRGLNASALALGIADKTTAALKDMSARGWQGARDIAQVGERTVRTARHAADGLLASLGSDHAAADGADGVDRTNKDR